MCEERSLRRGRGCLSNFGSPETESPFLGRPSRLRLDAAPFGIRRQHQRGERVDFVEEDDRGGPLARHLKERPKELLRLAPPLGGEVCQRDREEGPAELERDLHAQRLRF